MIRLVPKDLEFIKSWEHLVNHWYDAGDGLKTGGWGHVQLLGEESITFISDAQASVWLEKDIDIVEHAVSKLVNIATTHNQYLALCSLVFNIGVGAFQKSQTRKVINSSQGSADDNKAIADFWADHIFNTANGVKMKGLMARRAAEAKLWETVG